MRRGILRRILVVSIAGLFGVAATCAVALLAVRGYNEPEAAPLCPVDLTAQIQDLEVRSIVRLRDLTPFEWSSVESFGEYAPGELVRKTGHPYRTVQPFDHVPECTVLFVFRQDDDKTCAAVLDRSSGKWLNPSPPFAETDPVYVVRKEGDDPRFTNCGPS